MGAWSHTSFGNDAAMDFVADVERDGMSAIVAAIQAVEDIGEDYLDSWEASMALAAGEFLAAANGKPPTDYPGAVSAILSKVTPDAALRARAAAVARRILAGPESELLDLWQEGDGFDDWSADVTGLIARLQ